MVTNETTKEILFLLKDDIFTKFIICVTKFLPLPPKIIFLDNQSQEIICLSETKTLPLLKASDLYFSGTLPIIKYLIKSAKDISDGIYLDNRIILLGKNIKEEAKIDMWLNFILEKIFPISAEIEQQLYGKKKFDIRRFEYALNDLLEILVDINDYLTFNTFLTANYVQLSDIMLASALFICYNDLFTKNEIDLIPNIIRNFKFVANMKHFKSVFGPAIPCKKVKKHEPFIEKIINENKNINNNNDDEKEAKKKKKNINKEKK